MPVNDWTIRSLVAVPLDIALREPFGIAGGTQHVARNVLVTIELADGTRGYGEAAPLPAFNGETQHAAHDAATASSAAVVGEDARAWGRIAAAVAEATAIGSARCAIEMAVLDAFARRADLPLWALYGGAEWRLETDITIPTGSVEHAAASAARAAREGFRRLKIKVGAGPLDDDAARVRAAIAAAPEATVMLDANAGLTPDAAIELVDRLAGAPIALFEQPCARGDWEGLRRVREATRLRIALDESIARAGDVQRARDERAGDVVNVKLMKNGIAEAVAIAMAARAAGFGLMVGGMVESILAMSASACVAAGLGGFAFVDLDTPLFMRDAPFAGGFAQRGPEIDVAAIRAGHGVVPRAPA